MSAPERISTTRVINEALGDVRLGKYKVVNTVTHIESDRLIEWNVGAPGRTPIGHVYGYELDALITRS